MRLEERIVAIMSLRSASEAIDRGYWKRIKPAEVAAIKVLAARDLRDHIKGCSICHQMNGARCEFAQAAAKFIGKET